jgi:hypothetical protein
MVVVVGLGLGWPFRHCGNIGNVEKRMLCKAAAAAAQHNQQRVGYCSSGSMCTGEAAGEVIITVHIARRFNEEEEEADASQKSPCPPYLAIRVPQFLPIGVSITIRVTLTQRMCPGVTSSGKVLHR